MSIKKLIKTVTAKELEKTQSAVKAHFEGGNQTAQMIMIAFD